MKSSLTDPAFIRQLEALKECGHLAHKYSITSKLAGKMPALLEFPNP